MKRLLLTTGILLLFAAEILRVYFIMPFPGSQHRNTVAFAYWLNNNIIWVRLLAFLMIIFPLWAILTKGKIRLRIVLSLILILYAVVFFFFNYRFEADKMFYQPKQKNFIGALTDTTSRNELVIGVAFNGEAKAYPIRVIGYHHQVMDTVGNVPVMVTYCTVCRTGRVYSPFINGRKASFRLVGMDHFNAMFEDAGTGTWWRQATGKAIAGPLKGRAILELPSKQLTLAAWLAQYPNSYIMQPDTTFKKEYAGLAGYDDGTVKSSLEGRDSASWKAKSWVIGITGNQASKAYDWNELVKTRLINDSLSNLPVLLVLEKDKASFHLYNRRVNGIALHFETKSGDTFTDDQTHSEWSMEGICTAGPLKGQKLSAVQGYQEFWHSWRTFHPNTTSYNN